MQYLIKLLSFLLFLSLFNCKNNMNVLDSPPPSTNLVGKWEWTKTVDGNGKITTPTTLGYGKSMSYGNSDKIDGDYLYLLENNNPPLILKQENSFGRSAISGDTLILASQFSDKYVEFSLLKNSDNIYLELIRTDLVSDYSKGFGDTKHYYKKVGVADKP